MERQLGVRAEASAHSVLDAIDELRVYAGVLEAHLQVVLSRAADEDAGQVELAELLEVDVPDPADVVAVGVVVVEEERHQAAVGRLDLADHAVEAGGVLCEVAHHVAPEHVPRLHASARGLVAGDHLVEAGGARARKLERGDDGGNVEHHIQAVVARLHVAPKAIGPADVPGVAAVLVAGKLDVARGEAELRARPSALGAAVLAELPVVHVLVVKRRVAQGAEAGVADAVRLEPRGLVDAEADARVVHARGDGGT